MPELPPPPGLPASPPDGPPPGTPPPPPAPHLPQIREEGRPAIPPPTRQLPEVTGNKVDRMVYQLQRLIENLREWIELKVELTKLELWDEINAKLIEVATKYGWKIGGTLGTLVMAIYTLTFFFITLAFGIGALFGGTGWGFLIVTLMMLVITMLLGRKFVYPYMKQGKDNEKDVGDIDPDMAAAAKAGADLPNPEPESDTSSSK